MGGFDTSSGASYGNIAALVFVFNLVVGVGGLTMPVNFNRAGYVLGTLFVALLGFLSYMTVTFVVEAMAAANAMLLHNAKRNAVDTPASIAPAANLSVQIPSAADGDSKASVSANASSSASSASDGDSEETEEERTSPFRISQRTEMGLMAQLFLGRKGTLLFYAIMILYLYGDLAIYAVSVPTTLASFTGGFGGLSSGAVYYIYVLLFACIVVPASFFTFQNTKVFQICTMATRNVAFFTMIVVGLMYAVRGDGFEHPPASDATNAHTAANFSQIGALYGCTVYSFMCHHSLPSIITPIKHKRNLTKLFLADYIFIAICYSGLCLSALFAFGGVTASDCASHPSTPCKPQSLYTLNFSSFNVRPIADYLTLFPCFTLTTNYPLIAITLRNNLQNLFASFNESDAAALSGSSNPNRVPLIADDPVRAAELAKKDLARKRIIFAAAASIPPIGLACATSHLDALVSFTGAFAGVAIQFLIPTALVYYSRRSVIGDESADAPLTLLASPAGDEFPPARVSPSNQSHTSDDGGAGLLGAAQPLVRSRNIHRSPFSHPGWLYGMFVWSGVSLVANLYLQITKLAG